MSNWISNDEKFSLIGLDVECSELEPGPVHFGETLFAFSKGNIPFPLVDFWRDCLGSLRSKEIEDCRMFLMAKRPSQNASILDAEMDGLANRVHQFYRGLLIAKNFGMNYKPIQICGGMIDGKLHIRQIRYVDQPIAAQIEFEDSLLLGSIQNAAEIAENLLEIENDHKSKNKSYWRLNRIIYLYLNARAHKQIADKFHQLCRCIDGIICSKKGEGRRHFKSRTQLFIGPSHHEMMGEIYDIRSHFEHLDEHLYFENNDRKIRENLYTKLCILDFLVRTIIQHTLKNVHFRNLAGTKAGLQEFWEMSDDDRKRIWAKPPIEVDAILRSINIDCLSNEELGLPNGT